MSETNDLSALLCCPFCGSSDVEDDYSGVQTTFNGTRENPTGWHEYQTGWVDCNSCGAQGPSVRAKDEQIPQVCDMTRDAWNKAPRALNMKDAIENKGALGAPSAGSACSTAPDEDYPPCPNCDDSCTQYDGEVSGEQSNGEVVTLDIYACPSCGYEWTE